MALYEAEYPKGTRVMIAPTADLERFRREWNLHTSLTDDQLAHAGEVTTVRDVGFYHGGDALYELEKVYRVCGMSSV
jgi:hypothetical protein